MADQPIKKNAAFTFFIPGLVSQANTKLFQTNPTIAAGDFTISGDGGNFGNPATIPDVEPNGTTQVRVQLSATEMNYDQITVKWSDQAGSEWCDGSMIILTSAAQMGELSTLNAAGVRSAVGLAAANLDTQLGDLPTAAENADATWDELLAGHAVAGSTGEALTNAGAAATPPTEAEIWAYATRTLTQTAAQVVAAVAGSSLSVVKHVDFSASLTGLTISALWTKIWFTIKSDKSADDDEAKIQIAESNPAAGTDGVLYFNAAAATVAQQAQGWLTVNQGAGTIGIDIDDDLTADLEAGRYSYDVKLLTASGTQLLTSGTVNVTETETHAIA